MYYIKPKIVVTSLTKEVFDDFEVGEVVLFLCSKTIYKEHNIDKLIKSFPKEKKIHLFTHVGPDAPFEDLDKILDSFEDAKPESIVAIGGGSVIDAAKALSVAFGQKEYKDIFYNRTSIPTNKIKVMAIPTTAGTGAELSFGAILYDKKSKKKGGIRGEIVQPDYVVIDSKLHNAAPSKLKAEVGFDCLTHAVETYISHKSTPIIKAKSVQCLRVLFSHLYRAAVENSISDMEKVAIASSMMGINLAFSSTCLPHRIQYVIGPMTGTSHAQGLIGLYKGWLKHLKNENIEALNSLANDLGLEMEVLLEKIDNLRQSLGIDYNLAHLGIKENEIDKIANAVSGNVQADPSYKNIDSIKNILKLSF